VHVDFLFFLPEMVNKVEYNDLGERGVKYRWGIRL